MSNVKKLCYFAAMFVTWSALIVAAMLYITSPDVWYAGDYDYNEKINK